MAEPLPRHAAAAREIAEKIGAHPDDKDMAYLMALKMLAAEREATLAERDVGSLPHVDVQTEVELGDVDFLRWLAEAGMQPQFFRALADRIERLEAVAAKLLRVRDWLKYAANSEGGIVEEIDAALAAREAT